MVRRLFISCRFYIAGSSKGRTSLSESENFGSIPSPATNRKISAKARFLFVAGRSAGMHSVLESKPD